MKDGGSSNTAKEIEFQPDLWLKTYSVIDSRRQELKVFMDKALAFENLQVILIGAGTSAYIGEVLQPSVQRKLKRTTQAIASTDFISHPEDFVKKKTGTYFIDLFCSFGR